MTPEEKTVIDAAMKWHYAILAYPSAIPLVPMSGPALALEGISRATRALSVACPQCNAGGHVCPGDGNHISHTATDCGEHDLLEYPLGKRRNAFTFPCWECLTDPTEDPRPWCDCREHHESAHPYPCRFRAHAPEHCPNRPTVPPRPTEDEYGSLPILNIEILKTGPNTETHIITDHSYADVTSNPAGGEQPMSAENPETDPPIITSFKVVQVRNDDPVWVDSTLLFCLAGDRIRIGADETDVLRSSSGAWHANVVSSVLPSGKTWDKVTPWTHTELRLDFSANPGFQEYPPNLPCEILCNPERLAVLTLMTGFPGTTEVK